LKRKLRRSKASVKYCRINIWSKVEKYILEKIKQYYSPKQISWRWTLKTDERLSKDTIYSYIYNNYPELISKYFRRKWKKYQNKRKQKYQLDNRRMIDRRPKVIEKRTTLGHWESDTVVWKRKTRTKKCILTNVDRKSWLLIARILPNAQANSVVKATLKDFSNLPKYKRKTMTFDNWREFAYHYDIERELKITTYFAHPYCSWERWTNENTNWLLRQFLPKGSDFELLEEKELQKYVALINNRPRERLNFLTPNEVFNNKTKSCIWL
jgi:IS30 family transposase